MGPLSYVGLRKMVLVQCREHVEFKNHGVQEPPCLQWPDIGSWSHPRVVGQETTTHQGMLPLSYVGLRKMVQAQCREHGVQEPRYPGVRPSLQWPDIGTWSHPRVLGQETNTHQGMLPFTYVRALGKWSTPSAAESRRLPSRHSLHKPVK